MMDVLSLEEIGRLPYETALTIGIFDGVHRGHQRLVELACEAAREPECRAVAMTFDPHPAEVVAPQNRPPLLTTVDQRIELLGQSDLDALVIARDLPALFALEPEAFVEAVLASRLRARVVVEGPDWTFGRGRSGDMRLLSELGASHGFEAREVPWVEEDGGRVSSTAIREMLRNGDVAAAARCLGRPYFADGTVVSGAGRGVGLGVPTANIATVNELLPAPGVYAGSGRVTENVYAAALFVGQSLTFGGTDLVLEAYLIDFPGSDIHGSAIRVSFAERLRDIRRFDTPEALVEQMRYDIDAARRAAGSLRNG